MSRLKQIDSKQASGEVTELLTNVEQKLGMIPNIMKTFANSPATLKAYLAFGEALQDGILEPSLHQQIALVVAQANDCPYCLAAHTAIGKSLGLSAEVLLDARAGKSSNTKTQAVLQFARSIVEKRGKVLDAEIHTVRHAGFDDNAISEIISVVSHNIFRNYFDLVGGPPIDFPPVEPLPQTESARHPIE